MHTRLGFSMTSALKIQVKVYFYSIFSSMRYSLNWHSLTFKWVAQYFWHLIFEQNSTSMPIDPCPLKLHHCTEVMLKLMFLFCARVHMLRKLPIELEGLALNIERHLPKEILRRTSARLLLTYIRQLGPGRKRRTLAQHHNSLHLPMKI